MRINIKPEIPQKKRLKEQYELVCDLAKEHKIVFWILDFDIILKETREHRKVERSPLDDFIEYRRELEKEYENVRIVVNNPCFEYWVLLHFVRTQKKYANCVGAIKQLEKELPGYEKTERYFKSRNNDIYLRLKPYLKDAIENAAAFGGFDIEQPKKAMCEMNVLFMIEELNKYRK